MAEDGSEGRATAAFHMDASISVGRFRIGSHCEIEFETALCER